jgi:hypothetical protein
MAALLSQASSSLGDNTKDLLDTVHTGKQPLSYMVTAEEPTRAEGLVVRLCSLHDTKKQSKNNKFSEKNYFELNISVDMQYSITKSCK